MQSGDEGLNRHACETDRPSGPDVDFLSLWTVPDKDRQHDSRVRRSNTGDLVNAAGIEEVQVSGTE